jgi:hypothetical protein
MRYILTCETAALQALKLPAAIADMRDPVQCARCGGCYDLAAVQDGHPGWRTPCCNYDTTSVGALVITNVPDGTRPADVSEALGHAWDEGRLTGAARAIAGRTRGGRGGVLQIVPDGAQIPAAVPAIDWDHLTPNPAATWPAAVGGGTRLGRPRPVVDPAIPAAGRQLLTGPGAPLIPASRPLPARGGGRMPRRAARAAQTWLVLAIIAAIRGVLSLGQGGSVFLWIALFIAVLTVLRTTVLPVGYAHPAAGRCTAAGRAARRWHGRYLTPADFDPEAGLLLARAQHAIAVITAAGIFRDGLLDGPADGSDLTTHEWDIARTLAGLTRLRKDPAPAAGAELQAIADTQASVTARIAALEAYAAEVAAAETAWQAWQAGALPELGDGAADLLAATAGHDHATAALRAQAQRATAARHALRELTAGVPPAPDTGSASAQSRLGKTVATFRVMQDLIRPADDDDSQP